MIKFLLQVSRPIRYWINSITYKYSCCADELSRLKGKYKDQPMLVVGNGPSLNFTPLGDFKDIPSIGMNKIDLIYSKTSWRPNIVVCVNNVVVMQHWRSFIDSDIPIYLSWKNRRFVPRKFRNRLNYFLSLNTRDFKKEIDSGLGSSVTVTYSALQIAYYLGANPVILFGVDHNFSHSGKAQEYAKATGPDVNHFDPNYFKDGSWWGLPDLEESENAYLRAKEAFENDGRKIFDATIDGKLNIFPKITIEQAKEMCKIL